MKIAYLILAHNNPSHLERLIHALKTTDSGFFIHIDKKSKLDDFIHLTSPQVIFSSKRIPIYWGTFSQVEATLSLIKDALAFGEDYDYFVLLSGADYPIQSPLYIHDFFTRYKGQQFISTLKMPNLAAGKPLDLLEDYNIEGKFKRVKKRIYHLLKKLKVPFLKRNYQDLLGNLTPYAGAQWWALSREACEYVVDFVDSNPRFVHLYEKVVIPDEMFFQTIIGNSPYAASLARSVTYSDWRPGKSSPENMTVSHVEKLKKNKQFIMKCSNYGEGEILFARKFIDDTSDIVNLLKSYIYA